MKRFEFTMESLLRVKKSLLDLEDHRLKGLLAKRRSAEANRRRVQDERRRQAELVASLTTFTGTTAHSYSHYQNQSRAQLLRMDQDILRLEEKIEAQRLRVRSLSVEVQMLAGLRDRAYKQWLKGVDREIEQSGTESYLSRFVRESHKRLGHQ